MVVRLSALRSDHDLSPPPPRNILVFIYVGGWVNPRAIVRLEGLGKLKKEFDDLIGNRTRFLSASGIIPLPSSSFESLFLLSLPSASVSILIFVTAYFIFSFFHSLPTGLLNGFCFLLSTLSVNRPHKPTVSYLLTSLYHPLVTHIHFISHLCVLVKRLQVLSFILLWPVRSGLMYRVSFSRVLSRFACFSTPKTEARSPETSAKFYRLHGITTQKK
jgi:hypothetical protein